LEFGSQALESTLTPLHASEASAAFATPTIVHFSIVLLISALLHAPWETITPVELMCCVIGIGGIAYTLLTARRMRVQTAYKLVS
jgi:hypothetical protein